VTLASSYSGADTGNYQVTDQASTTADITAKALTVSGLTAFDKVYDGSTVASINTSQAIFDGLINGDVLGLSATGAFDTADVGTNKVVALASSYSGIDAGNYDILSQQTAQADIMPQRVETAGLPPVFVAQPLSMSPPPTLVDPVVQPIPTEQVTPISTEIAVAPTGATGVTAGSETPVVAETRSGPTNGTPRVTQATSQVTVSLVRSVASSDVGIVTVTIPRAIVDGGTGFTFVLPSEVVQTRGIAKATLVNGSPLPGWLSFVPESRTFIAKRLSSGAMPLRVLVEIGDQKWQCVITELN